jgi:hypothetical protein
MSEPSDPHNSAAGWSNWDGGPEGERIVEEIATYRGEGQCFL